MKVGKVYTRETATAMGPVSVWNKIKAESAGTSCGKSRREKAYCNKVSTMQEQTQIQWKESNEKEINS